MALCCKSVGDRTLGDKINTTPVWLLTLLAGLWTGTGAFFYVQGAVIGKVLAFSLVAGLRFPPASFAQ